MKEKIYTVWKLGYIYLFDMGDDEYHTIIHKGEEQEWKKIFWRFYWRVY